MLGMLIGFVVVIAVMMAKRYLRTPAGKGQVGEWEVRLILKQLNKDKYASFHDLLLPTADGKTTQIDHVVVSYFGVFVIETKNYGGTIYGNESQGKWTQMLGKHKHSVYNPIWQNHGHIKALQELFADMPDVPFHSVVVFSNRAKLKVETRSAQVVHAGQLKAALTGQRAEVLSDEQVLALCDRLEERDLSGRKARKEHVAAIQEAAAGRERSISEGVCPKCGEKLVLRSGKYGEFYGCSGYPKCRFKVKGLEESK